MLLQISDGILDIPNFNPTASWPEGSGQPDLDLTQLWTHTIITYDFQIAKVDHSGIHKICCLLPKKYCT